MFLEFGQGHRTIELSSSLCFLAFQIDMQSNPLKGYPLLSLLLMRLRASISH